MVTDSTTKARALPARWDSKNFVEEGSEDTWEVHSKRLDWRSL